MPLPVFTPRARHPGRQSLRRCRWALLVFFTVVAALPVVVRAQTTPPNLTGLSIEDLMNIEITSASRKEQRIRDVASAVFVITQDDIRRSGMTTIPDLLRLAPGVNVAQVNANKWAVSVRGFNSLFASKLLVLVDGRSIYNRVYSGVLWDMLDLMVDDVERIEVIRGPGASAWGANAVNGVINIVTMSAADSQRGLVRADAGGNGTQAAIRYGGTAFNTPYRVFAQWTDRDESVLVPGIQASDGSYSVTAGLRADRSTGRGVFTLEGAFTSGRLRPLWLNLNAATAATEPVLNDSSETRSGHVLGRWAHTSGGVGLQIQSSLDLADRREAVGHFTRHALDMEAQGRKTIDGRHDLVAGVGYRWVGERVDGQNGITLTPPDDHSTLLTAFAHDDIALAASRVHLILGTQVQHDSFSGTGMQPTARLIWHLRWNQRMWVAASRALRTPSSSDRGIRVDYPPLPTPVGLPLFPIILGNPALESETFADLEAGYRIEIGNTGSIDATAFAGRYRNLIASEASAPTLVFVPAPHLQVISRNRNHLVATTRGVEVAGHWAPRPSWSVDGSVSVLSVRTRLPNGDAAVEADVPRTQWQLRTVFTPVPRATVTASLFHAGRLPTSGIEGYTRADLTAEWRLTDRLGLMALGQNLLTAEHPEFSGAGTLLIATQVPRSVGVRLRWSFQ